MLLSTCIAVVLLVVGERCVATLRVGVDTALAEAKRYVLPVFGRVGADWLCRREMKGGEADSCAGDCADARRGAVVLDTYEIMKCCRWCECAGVEHG